MRSKKATPYGKRRLKEGLSLVTRYWGVTNSEVLGRSRLRNITNARHSLRYYLCMSDDLTLSEIGLLTNGDHSTVLHSNKTFEILTECQSDLEPMMSPTSGCISNCPVIIGKPAIVCFGYSPCNKGHSRHAVCMVEGLLRGASFHSVYKCMYYRLFRLTPSISRNCNGTHPSR